METVAEYSYRLSGGNSSYQDNRARLRKFIEQLYEFRNIYDNLTEEKAKEWCLRLFSQLAEANGKDIGSSRLNSTSRRERERPLLSGGLSKKLNFVTEQENESLSKSVQELGNVFNGRGGAGGFVATQAEMTEGNRAQNSTTLSTIQRSFNKDINTQAVLGHMSFEELE